MSFPYLEGDGEILGREIDLSDKTNELLGISDDTFSRAEVLLDGIIYDVTDYDGGALGERGAFFAHPLNPNGHVMIVQNVCEDLETTRIIMDSPSPSLIAPGMRGFVTTDLTLINNGNSNKKTELPKGFVLDQSVSAETRHPSGVWTRKDIGQQNFGIHAGNQLNQKGVDTLRMMLGLSVGQAELMTAEDAIREANNVLKILQKVNPMTRDISVAGINNLYTVD